jgi:hypothetical protein
MTIFHGSISISSQFFLQSGSGVMTLFYLVVQLHRNNESGHTIM